MTTYKILRRDGNEVLTEVTEYEAGGAQAAIRKALTENGGAVYVAVPKRSWTEIEATIVKKEVASLTLRGGQAPVQPTLAEVPTLGGNAA